MKSFVPLIQTQWRMLLFGFTMMFCSSPGQTYFIALFGGEIRHDLSLSHGEFGAIYSLATLASAFALLWSGALIDKVELRKFSTIIVLALATACVLMSTASNTVVLFAVIFLLRQLGQGLMSMASATAMMRYVSVGKAKANSLSNLGYSSAEAILPTLVIALMLTLGWRQSWLVVAACLLLVPMLIYLALGDHRARHAGYQKKLEDSLAPRSIDNSDQHVTRQWTRSEVIRDPLFYLFVPGLLSQSMLFTGFMFHQIYLVEAKGWSLLTWGNLYALYALASIATTLVVGAWVDRVGAIKLAPFVTLPMACGLILLSSSAAIPVAAGFMLGMALSSGAQAATVAPFFSQRYGNKHLGAVKSLGTFIMVIMSAISPAALGWLIDIGVSIDVLARYSAAYAFCVAGLGYVAYRLFLREEMRNLSNRL
jgi:sugar phosphate permease